MKVRNPIAAGPASHASGGFFPGEGVNSGKGAEGGGEVDLFGLPVVACRDPRGRPQYAKNKENQLFVIQMRGAGLSQQDIADLMGCDVKTLTKHFSRELAHGALQVRSMAVQVLHRRMMDGNVGAAKHVMEMADAAHAPRGDKGKAPAKAAAEVKPGKKQQLRDDAQQPTGGWADLLPRH